MFPDFKTKITDALDLIDSVPGYGRTAMRLRRLSIEYLPSLPDRAHITLRSKIIVGPAALVDGGKPPVGLAGTLVHEEFHSRQHPLLKTASFWTGVFTRTPVMSRFEWPAYREQTAFLRALSASRPDLADDARREIDAIVEAVYRYYGRPPFDL
jgi:hypothetical protein